MRINLLDSPRLLETKMTTRPVQPHAEPGQELTDLLTRLLQAETGIAIDQILIDALGSNNDRVRQLAADILQRRI